MCKLMNDYIFGKNMIFCVYLFTILVLFVDCRNIKPKQSEIDKIIGYKDVNHHINFTPCNDKDCSKSKINSHHQKHSRTSGHHGKHQYRKSRRGRKHVRNLPVSHGLTLQGEDPNVLPQNHGFNFSPRRPDRVSRLENEMHKNIRIPAKEFMDNLQKILRKVQEKVRTVDNEYITIGTTGKNAMVEVRKELGLITEENNNVYDALLDVSQLVRYVYRRAHEHGLTAPVSMSSISYPNLNIPSLRKDMRKCQIAERNASIIYNNVMSYKRRGVQQDAAKSDVMNRVKDKTLSEKFRYFEMYDLQQKVRWTLQKVDTLSTNVFVPLRRRMMKHKSVRNTVTERIKHAKYLYGLSNASMKTARDTFQVNKKYHQRIQHDKYSRRNPNGRYRRSVDYSQLEILSQRVNRRIRLLEAVAFVVNRKITPLLTKSAVVIEERRNAGAGVLLQIRNILTKVVATVTKLDNKMDEIRVFLKDDKILEARCQELLNSADKRSDVIDCQKYDIYEGSGSGTEIDDEDGIFTLTSTTKRTTQGGSSSGTTTVSTSTNTTHLVINPSTEIETSPKTTTTEAYLNTTRHLEAKTKTTTTKTHLNDTTIETSTSSSIATKQSTFTEPSTASTKLNRPTSVSLNATTPSPSTTSSTKLQPFSSEPTKLPTTTKPTSDPSTTAKDTPSTTKKTPSTPKSTSTSNPTTTVGITKSLSTPSPTIKDTPSTTQSTTGTTKLLTTATTLETAATTTDDDVVDGTGDGDSVTKEDKIIDGSGDDSTGVDEERPVTTERQVIEGTSEDRSKVESTTADDFEFETTEAASTKSPPPTIATTTTATTITPTTKTTTSHSTPASSLTTSTTTSKPITEEDKITKEEGSGESESEFSFEEETKNEKEKEKESGGGWGWPWGGDDPNVLYDAQRDFKEKLTNIAHESRIKSNEVHQNLVNVSSKYSDLQKRWQTITDNLMHLGSYVNLASGLKISWNTAELLIDDKKMKMKKLPSKVIIENSINQSKNALLVANEKLNKMLKLKQQRLEKNSANEYGPAFIADLISKVQTVNQKSEALEKLQKNNPTPCKDVQNTATRLRNSIAQLRSKIYKAKTITSAIPLTITMDGKDFVKATVPQQSLSVSPTSSIGICVKPRGENMNVATFYSNSTESYSIHLEDLKPVLKITDKDGTNIDTISFDTSLNKDEWNTIDIKRTARTVEMRINDINETVTGTVEDSHLPYMSAIQTPIVNAVIGKTTMSGDLPFFSGCIGDVMINGRHVAFSKNKEPIRPCGSDCKPEESKSMVFEGEGFAKFSLYLIDVNYVDDIHLQFQTLQKDGVLLFIKKLKTLQVSVSLSEGSLHVEVSKKRGTTVRSSSKDTYSDGKDHMLNIVFNGDRIDITTEDEEDKFEQESIRQEITSRIDDGIFLGGLGVQSHSLSGKTKLRSFSGCISKFVISKKEIPFYMIEESKNVYYGKCKENIWRKCVNFIDKSTPIKVLQKDNAIKVYIVYASNSIGTLLHLQRIKGEDFDVTIYVDNMGLEISDNKDGIEYKLQPDALNKDFHVLSIEDNDSNSLLVRIDQTSIDIPYSRPWRWTTPDLIFDVAVGGHVKDDAASFQGGMSSLIINDRVIELGPYLEKNNLRLCERLEMIHLDSDKKEKPTC